MTHNLNYYIKKLNGKGLFLRKVDPEVVMKELLKDIKKNPNLLRELLPKVMNEKALEVIGKMCVTEILKAFNYNMVKIPFSVWNSELVNAFFGEVEKEKLYIYERFLNFILNCDNADLVSRVFSLLSEDRLEFFKENFADIVAANNSYYIMNEIVTKLPKELLEDAQIQNNIIDYLKKKNDWLQFVKMLSDIDITQSLFSALVNSISDSNLIFLIASENISIEAKEKIFELRKKELIECFRTKDNPQINQIFNQLLTEKSTPDKIITEIIPAIPKEELIELLSSRYISDTIKEKIYITRNIEVKEEIEKLISKSKTLLETIQDNFLGIYAIYEPLFIDIIKNNKFNINDLINTVDYLISTLSGNYYCHFASLILKIHGKEINNYLYKIENVNSEMLKFIADIYSSNNEEVKIHLSDDIISHIIEKIPIEEFINYLKAYTLPDYFIELFFKDEERIKQFMPLFSEKGNNYSTIMHFLKAKVQDEIFKQIIIKIDGNILFSLLSCSDTDIRDKIKNIIIKDKIQWDNIASQINLAFMKAFNIKDSNLPQDIKEKIGYCTPLQLYNIFPFDNFSNENLLDFLNYIDSKKLLINSEIINEMRRVIRLNKQYKEIFNIEDKKAKIKMIKKLTKEDFLTMFFKHISSGRDISNLRFMFFECGQKELIINNCKDYSALLMILNHPSYEKEIKYIVSKLKISDLTAIIRKNIAYYQTVEKIIIEQLKESIKIADIDIIEIIKYIKREKDVDIFINHLVDILNFTKDNLGDVSKLFLSYASFEDSPWIEYIYNIINNKQEKKFNENSTKLLKRIYRIDISNANLKLVQSFLDLLHNYNRYPELCNYIANLDRELTKEEITKIEFLFGNSNTLLNDIAITNIDDLSTINNRYKEQIANILKNINNYTPSQLRDFLSSILFNQNIESINKLLSVYGNVEELRKLEFDNRNNPELCSEIEEMIIIVSLMEDIINLTDRDLLISTINNIYNNFDKNNIYMYFTQFEQKMRRIYELDSQLNLTKLSSLNAEDKTRVSVSKEEDITALLTSRDLYEEFKGVRVLDLSDKKYILLGHVVSWNEKIEDLVEGKSSGSQNFISLTPIGNRGINMINSTSANRPILATDTLPSGNFIISSTENMCSNALISANSNSVTDTQIRRQRGILESSNNGLGRNAETLTFRRDVKFKYFILPKGTKLNHEEIKLIKDNNLIVILTQPLGHTIESPKSITSEKASAIDEIAERDRTLEELRRLKESLVAKKKGERKKIAIFTDVHGFYKPALAILEDARKRGITEIYSLGDNIGTGPNPGEVIDLLQKYGVKSIKGNHELYVLNGIEAYREHLMNAGGEHAVEEARVNSIWTRRMLTPSQMETIRGWPKDYELKNGRQKDLLLHHIQDFNTGKVVVSPENYDRIFQGHIHFSSKNGNITTVRGAAIGLGDDLPGVAKYIILTENDDGGYSIEEREVPFNLDNQLNDINEAPSFVIDGEVISPETEKATLWLTGGRSR